MINGLTVLACWCAFWGAYRHIGVVVYEWSALTLPQWLVLMALGLAGVVLSFCIAGWSWSFRAVGGSES